MDARTRRKLRRQTERKLKEEGIDPGTVWFAMEPREEEETKAPVPGKDFYQETPEAQAKINSNSWDNNLEEVIAFIKWATRPDSEIFDEKGQYKPGEKDWSWVRNMDCKYINLRIDMRDGGFVLINGKKERISLDALKWQYDNER